MVVHLGGIDGGIFGEERELRKRYDAGERDGAEIDLLRRGAVERRGEAAKTHLPLAKRSLAEIAEYAVTRNVAVGLENRYHYHEFPGPGEMRELLEEYPPEVAGLWLDVGHAEVLDRLGLERHDRWLTELGHRCMGARVADVAGLADDRAPGDVTARSP